MLVLQGYMVVMIAIGWKLATQSSSFERMSLWKQLIVLSISPLLLVRDIFKDFQKERR